MTDVISQAPVALPPEVLAMLEPAHDEIIRATRQILLDPRVTAFGRNLELRRRYYEQQYRGYVEEGVFTKSLMTALREGGVSTAPVTVPVNLPGEAMLTTTIDNQEYPEDYHDSESCEDCDCEDCGRDRSVSWCCGCCSYCNQRHENVYSNSHLHTMRANGVDVGFCTNCDHFCCQDTV